MKFVLGLLLIATVLEGAGVALARAPAEAAASPKLLLGEGWMLQSSAKVQEKGEALSSPEFSPTGWYATTVPSTVLAALVRNQVYPDPYFAKNLRSIPGTSYPIGQNFSNLPMLSESPFAVSWWYRTSFQLPAAFEGRELWLNFDGINFRANIWVNGRKIAGSDNVAGTWRLYEFNVTGVALPGKPNALAVEVFPPQQNDLALTWVDWNPAPPDKDMGIWRDVYVTASGPVALRYPQVVTHFDLPSLEVAHLTVNAELRNATSQPAKGTLRGQIGDIRFSQPVELAAQETRTVSFAPDRFPQLNVANPKLWWPAELGPQNLHTLKVEFEMAGKVSDRRSIQFGIREITSELNEKSYRVFSINGKRILIRGAGWAPDMLLRVLPKRQEAEIRYVKEMNLNTIRLEGKLEGEHFFDVCDREGILVLAGWCCCDHWERWRRWKDEDYPIAAQSLKDQVRRLRHHACLLDWLYGSDNAPPPKVEEMYIKILKDYLWPNPYQSSATAKPTSVTGRTGLKMTGPYEYVAPSYWLEDTEHGGARGFNTETSPGPAVPPVQSLRKFLPADRLWPINDDWDFHAGGGAFKNIEVFTRALNARYGNAASLEDYERKAQAMAYEGERAMFEAYGRNKYAATGVIQWMLNNAWPSFIWHLYDYYLYPAGGYFGTQKACEPLHIQYSYDDRSIVAVNSFYQEFKAMKATAQVYNFDLSAKFSRTATLDVSPDSSTRVFAIPELPGLSRTYFVRLTLENAAGALASSNFYWLSTQPDVSDWKNSTWYFTPISTYADLTALQSLPKVSLQVSSRTEPADGGTDASYVTVENPARNLAFLVHPKITKGKGGDEVLPVFWEDSYFPLLPGEKRTVKAVYRTDDLEGASPTVEVDGWNVAP